MLQKSLHYQTSWGLVLKGYELSVGYLRLFIGFWAKYVGTDTHIKAFV